jgi:O-antigen biosynthesis protein WbqP
VNGGKVNQLIKRIVDTCTALIGLIVLMPVFVVLFILVRRSSPGGAMFLQTRLGKGEIPFTCIKFRTMMVGSPDVGSHDAAESWITPTGRWLRAYKLDELPQLINVLRGEMSLVGPRPCLASQQEVISARRIRGVFSVRPGITGLAQVEGVDMSTPEKLAAMDAEYITTANIWRDCELIVRTVLGRGKGDAVK